jgi:hypothetical protein
MDLMKTRWHRYHYKNITYFFVSIIIAFFLFQNGTFHQFLLNLGSYGYIGAFIGGILFVSTFTVSIGTVVLLNLVEYLNPLEIAIVAGIGAVIGDMTIFQFIRTKGLVDEIKHFFHYFGSDKLAHLLHTKYFSWTLPVIGALIIASPLPDELGVGLMGISHMKTSRFLLISFILNSVGIFLVLSASILIKP